jgi:DNA-binding LacI/PurR family transcriptional regulator
MPVSRRAAGSSRAETDESDVTAVRRANIDALTILSLPADHPAAMLPIARGIRLVTTTASNDPESTWVAIDDFGAGVMVGEHLAGLGHRDIAVLGETNQPAGSPGQCLDATRLSVLDYASRVAGLRKSIPGQVMIVSGGHNSIESGNTAAIWLLDNEQLPTAVVCLSDVLALGALQALGSRGPSTPGDVSVCGFDDIPAAKAADLTTIHQPIREKGQHVGRLLIDPPSTPARRCCPSAWLRVPAPVLRLSRRPGTSTSFRRPARGRRTRGRPDMSAPRFGPAAPRTRSSPAGPADREQ